MHKILTTLYRDHLQKIFIVILLSDQNEIKYNMEPFGVSFISEKREFLILSGFYFHLHNKIMLRNDIANYIFIQSKCMFLKP